MGKQDRWLNLVTDAEAAKALLEWWSSLDNRRGDRAELRRCHDVVDVNLCGGFHRLRAALRPHGRHAAARLAVVGGVLSHVREHDGSCPLAAQMASKAKGSDRALVSGLRFKRLLAVEDPNLLLTPLSRVVKLVRGRANVIGIADGVIRWSKLTRTRWAYEYYDHAPGKEA